MNTIGQDFFWKEPSMSTSKLLFLGVMAASMIAGTTLLVFGNPPDQSVSTALKCRNAAPRVLQILGSGGPELDEGRNSTGYVIWINGKAKILIDVGSGVAESFGRNGGLVSDLDFIGLSHFHVDHTVGLPALVKNYFFEPSQKHIIIAGPPAGSFSPSIQGFLSALFGTDNSAFPYLDEMVGDKSKDFEARLVTAEPRKVLLQNKSYKIITSHVEHGAFPAIAYRIEFGDKALVFSGDTRANDNTLIDLAKGATLFIAHHAVPQTATGIAARLHMKPSRIGETSQQAGIKTLILSHRMKRTIGKKVEADSLKAIRKAYVGPIIWAKDGQCIPF